MNINRVRTMGRLASSIRNSRSGAAVEDALGLSAIFVLVICGLALPGLY
ncbi:MAG: hypothetical protein ACE5FS_02210 [Paracoccaceae bacterium]